MNDNTVPEPSDEGRWRKLATRPSDAEKVARAFHTEYERLAPRFAYTTRKASAVPWEDVPENNQALMMAVVQSLRDAGVIAIDLPRVRAEERAATLRNVEAWLWQNVRTNSSAVEVIGWRAAAEALAAHFNPDAER